MTAGFAVGGGVTFRTGGGNTLNLDGAMAGGAYTMTNNAAGDGVININGGKGFAGALTLTNTGTSLTVTVDNATGLAQTPLVQALGQV